MTVYSPELAEKICTLISTGNSLVKTCKILEIEYRHVFKWLHEYKEFEDNYMRSREAQADYHADEIIDISDTEEDSNKARVRIDARKWVAGKMRPKKYGDKTIHAGDPDNPMEVITRIERVIVDPKNTNS